MTARPLAAYLEAAAGPARLSAHAGRLVRLQRLLERTAPPHLATACRVANLKGGKVVLHADSGAVAARLRQMLPTLREAFFSKGFEVTEIQLKVQERTVALQQKNAGPPRAIGPVARAGLGRLATSLPAGSPLQAALGRLVRASGGEDV